MFLENLELLNLVLIMIVGVILSIQVFLVSKNIKKKTDTKTYEYFDSLTTKIEKLIVITENTHKKLNEIQVTESTPLYTSINRDEITNIDRKENETNTQNASLRRSDHKMGEINKIVNSFNMIRSGKYSENTLQFVRVKLEVFQGIELSDLVRKRLLIRSNSGSYIILTTRDDKYLLFPYFRLEELNEEAKQFFEGPSDFINIVTPALCSKVGEKYDLLKKGTVE